MVHCGWRRKFHQQERPAVWLALRCNIEDAPISNLWTRSSNQEFVQASVRVSTEARRAFMVGATGIEPVTPSV
jgi:hypothetical protein